MTKQQRIREIPYNYTSFSDKEIVTRFLNEDMWDTLNALRNSRKTGRSARMLFEVLGDMWVVSRNPYIQDDLLENQSRRNSLIHALNHRVEQIVARANNNQQALLLVQHTQQAIDHFKSWFSQEYDLRKQTVKRLSRYTRKDNIHFSGYAKVAHVTDASDWRVEFPFVVITPDHERELIKIVKACVELGLSIIPRGGGTGYTGSAVPLNDRCVIINTEKLDKIGKIEQRQLEGNSEKSAIVHVGAGVVTRRVAEHAECENYMFAVDPTSQDASCIGGNIAMNAGGKKAVLWGTTLDNLLSWRMVTPEGQWLEVTREKHNLGKIHEQETVRFRISHFGKDGKTPVKAPEILQVPGKSMRKNALGKDVTDKFLSGLPGSQKEGCDGLITSGRFLLHRMPQHIRTVCLEFFGTDLSLAVPAVVEVKDYLDSLDAVYLTGLEHLDERYVKAVNYATKASGRGRPKMVLLADIASDDETAVSEAASEVIRLANARQAEGFVAISAEARKRFWLDRARTAAISAHTNAFKINEDVVIPLERLAEYSKGIERINIEHSIHNKLAMVEAVTRYLGSTEDGFKPVLEFENSAENDAIIQGKRDAALSHLTAVANRWQFLLDNLDSPARQHKDLLEPQQLQQARSSDSLFDLLQRYELRVSYRREVERPLKQIYNGREFESLHDELDRIHAELRTSRLFVATHMHAGDGNVHTNIPVNSNDYAMLHEADEVVARIMQLAESLGGVISGEHGIGITKLQFLDKQTIAAFEKYKQQVDPKDCFNPGKLQANADLRNAYTPSLRLVEQEALILEASELGELNAAIKDCLRCGKCKPVCNTHIPRANLLYSPRNKILATGLIIEAFLYEEQTRRGISIRHFDEMNDVADHCTVCHKCLSPCPVNIDFGDVTISMREVLRKQGQRRSSLGTRLSMLFLNTTRASTIKLMHSVFARVAYPAQRQLSRLYNSLFFNKKIPGATTGKPAIHEQVVHFIKHPMPSGLPARTARALLGLEDDKLVPILRDPEVDKPDTEAVFYFPGCGSERLFSEIGLATMAMLYDAGVQTVLPPGYLCCGYPQKSSGDTGKGKQISINNQVLFHRIANTLNYLDIKTVLVSCGTCIDQLLTYQFEKIFPGCRLMDIHEYLMEKGVSLSNTSGKKYIYHDPCHTPMKHHAPIKVASNLMNSEVLLSDRCCGEAGTFAVARPDIATQLRFRKQEELHKGIQQLTQNDRVQDENVKLLTSCPACQQGLSRYRDATGLKTDYIVVELARDRFGKNWQQEFINKVQQGGIERVLL